MTPAPLPTATDRAGAATVAITGSKGGVGKSNLVVNLAVALGRWGQRVLLVDGDLGLANVDVLLGLVPRHNVEHLVRGEIDLDDVLVEGPRNVRVLPAASGLPELSRLEPLARRRLLAALTAGSAGVDHMLIDTGAGLGEATLALQLAAEHVIVVTTPEPTSLVDTYATLKVLWTADPQKRIDLVVNSASAEDDGHRAYEQIAKAARHFLHREPGSLGIVLRDPRVGEAVRRQRPLLELFPDSPAARCYEQIALRLTLSGGERVFAPDYWQRLLRTTGLELPH
jgi:flagellar biosynthesis protein FlhG